ncbi:macro domain-containing protein [Sansalvadorimonas sp. 2012CJ34-2]|uniref:Macro domain-containing protein n=1 Tax=Parendozoicomonas callyspongiae TaxID=2942213 RepID=A0ABT0PN84_9GAMM|nr:macro domain-containing protein [Sansalvadorimonas sp. 2012CJ34-2]MCL6272197.1 macro domain-containing protein [Sansalvadorimonas sp. 2012CJ34-2]
MILYTKGNLLNAPAQALVNSVNTVGVMGRGIALMFKQRFKRNMKLYAAACKAQQVQVGRVFVTYTGELSGPRWIVNFPTKQHWRNPSKMEWIVAGLQDLKLFILENGVESIAIPPLGAGNGGLPWPEIRRQIELALFDLTDVEILVYEPTARYQNVTQSTLGI